MEWLVVGGSWREQRVRRTTQLTSTTNHQPLNTTPMIRLTHLGGEPFLLNAELIKFVEERPDTFITLTDDERVVVQESMEEVLRLAVEYQQTKMLMPTPREGH